MIMGKSVCGGIAFGRLEILKRKERKERKRADDPEREWERFERAAERAKRQLDELYKKAVVEVGEENAMIFDIHKMMIEDMYYLDSVKTNITDRGLCAEGAAAAAADGFIEMFDAMEDSYMSARAADVRDMSERIISVLEGAEKKSISPGGPAVIGADDLVPSQTVQLDRSDILAFVTEKGSESSHTSILARTMGIPAVVEAEGIIKEENNGCDVIVDGFSGRVYIDPDMNTVLEMRRKKQKADESRRLFRRLKGVKPVTRDGRKIMLCANIGSPEDMTAVCANDAMGVGLFRSEFIYLESETYPSEEKQFEAYRRAAVKAAGRRVVIRTVDMGADKKADYFDMPEEENPALGVRGIRICLTRTSMFKTQLRAIYRAAAYGKIAVMFPMITSVSEIRRIKEICAEVCGELAEEGVPFGGDIEMGIMIETPAAAVISDKLAEEVDFFSIGTNDLTQYTLASDRLSAEEDFRDARNTAVLRLIKTAADNAHRHGIRVGICGDMAADTSLTGMFLSMGIDELSVVPDMILPLKEIVVKTDVSEIKDKMLAQLE